MILQRKDQGRSNVPNCLSSSMDDPLHQPRNNKCVILVGT